jgi:preprotein translocase subunit YajC
LIDLVVIGIVVGVILLLVGMSVIILIVIFRRKQKRKQQTEIPINQIDKKVKRENDQIQSTSHSFSLYS